jgi:hypothetical protein
MTMRGNRSVIGSKVDLTILKGLCFQRGLPMKLLLIMCDTEDLLKVREIVENSDVCGYSEIPNLHGAGIFGKKLGTRAFPGTSCVIFTCIRDEKAVELAQRLSDLRKQCPETRTIHAATIPMDHFF